MAVRSWVGAASVVACAGLLFVAARGEAGDATEKEVQVSFNELKWNPMYPGGPEMAVVRGDPSKGAYDMLVRYKPGFDSGWHTHDAGYRGMVLEGTITNPVQGDAKPRQLAKGGYWYQPAGQNHATRCVSDTACLVFAHSDGGMTYHPTTADGKPAPMPKALEATSGAKK